MASHPPPDHHQDAVGQAVGWVKPTINTPPRITPLDACGWFHPPYGLIGRGCRKVGFYPTKVGRMPTLQLSISWNQRDQLALGCQFFRFPL